MNQINANLFTINPATRNPDSEALISRNEKMLQTLQKENINYSLLEEELLPLYNEFIPAYRNAVKNYTAMYNQKSYSNMNFVECFFS